ncbi:metallo-beta-lactamase, partial [Candidatus Magnetomorum sp. HK-1]
ILGSCFVQISANDFSVVFSGDLGPKITPILCKPDIPEFCDLLILESTYGDRVHSDRTQRISQLGKILNHALSDEGKVFIPAFALGRSQELIYEMDRLFTDTQWQTQFPKLTKKIPVFIDAPLGTEITKIYSNLSEYWDKEALDLLKHGDHPIDFDHLYVVESHHHHKKLLETNGPAIIIAGSGMCTGGRILNHLKLGLDDYKNDVLFVGYQAYGTLGRDILKYSQRQNGYVKIENEHVDIKANVYQLSGYSAHADQNDLLDWVNHMDEKPGAIKLVHGEDEAQMALKNVLIGRGYSVR